MHLCDLKDKMKAWVLENQAPIVEQKR